jgi:hypothetical protein
VSKQETTEAVIDRPNIEEAFVSDDDFALAASFIIIDQPSPRRQTLTWLQRSGQVRVPITNPSKIPVTVEVEVVVDGSPCQVAIQLPTGEVVPTNQLEINLEPDETIAPVIFLTPLARSLFSPQRETHVCYIRVVPRDEITSPYRLKAHLRTEPIIGPGWPIMVVAAILILLSVTLVSQLTEATNPAETTPKRWFAPMKKEPIAPEPAPLLSEAEPIEAEPDVVNYEAIFKEVAAQYKLDWRVLAEQAYWESRMDRYAVGAYQEAGLMQIYPTTWQEWSQKVGVTDPFDPYSNILVGAAYMAFLRDHFQSIGHPEDHWMLIAYNWGPVNLHQLLQSGGTWQTVPDGPRQYSQDILQAAETAQIRPEIHTLLQQQLAPVQD